MAQERTILPTPPLPVKNKVRVRAGGPWLWKSERQQVPGSAAATAPP